MRDAAIEHKNRAQELLEANNRYLEQVRAAKAEVQELQAQVAVLTAALKGHRDSMVKQCTEKPAPTHRHKKRGSTYRLIGFGRMQADSWFTTSPSGGFKDQEVSVDMHEVAIYRATEDGSLWARPIKEFNDGRFEPITA